jgi:hypothetical protein
VNSFTVSNASVGLLCDVDGKSGVDEPQPKIAEINMKRKAAASI